MLIRLVHNQNSQGVLLVSDIDSGLPNEAFGIYHKQPVYVPYHRTFFNGSGLVEVDTSKAGFIDLVPTTKVLLSQSEGVIKGLSDNSFMSVVEIPTGALSAPTVTSSTHDTDTAGGAGDGLLTINGTNFVSYDPDVTSIEITDGVTTVTVQEGDAGVSVSATTITVTAAAHGFATDGSEDITSITVTANGQSATDAPTIV